MTSRSWVLRIVALAVAMIAIATYAVRVWVFVPLDRQAADMSGRVRRVSDKISSLAEKAEVLARLRDEYAAAVDALDKLESTVTREGSVPYILVDFEDVASSSGATVVAVSVSPLSSASPYAELPVTIGVTGSYGEVKRFTEGIVSRGRAMGVKTFRLSAPRGGAMVEGSPVLEATLAVTLYVMPEGEKEK